MNIKVFYWGHRIYCAACKPGTIEVVERFILTWTIGSIFQAYGLWSHCCHYMEVRPVPKNPLWIDPPRNQLDTMRPRHK
uniref:DUF6708 domain-containing protein n=1 Tax=Escherichia sp. MOD1-EC7003 TaxID=2093900 RepID=UPI0031456CE2